MSPHATQIFKERGVDVDVKLGMGPDELIECIYQYDGLAVRSSTKVTREVLSAAKELKVIGRAGIGVDNLDIEAATAAGIPHPGLAQSQNPPSLVIPLNKPQSLKFRVT